MHVHHLPVHKTARYATLGDAADGPRDVWFVFHGYRQLAPRFLTYFQHLDDGSRLLIAPEGLSRFYTDAGSGVVGASWMTREDRTLEIEDYLRYLDLLAGHVLGPLDRNRITVTALGFSQGVATAARWAGQGAIPVNRLVLWGDQLPPEYDTPESVARLRDTELVVVHGRRDEYVSNDAAERHLDRLRRLGLRARYVTFDGGHRVDKAVLKDLAEGQV